MRLHQLTVTAFGPFADTQRVDFDRLASAGLYLLHGATGAGKTSVLDAVCYALYGEVPGPRRGQGQRTLRSDHAPTDLLTQVTLEVTLRGRRLRLERQPEQPRPKRKGEGVTVARARTTLSEWDPTEQSWRPLSRSHQEVGEELGQLLGMSRDQFCQVVLLPQGEFARFLRASAEDRATLLGKLFDTGRFGMVERRLAELRTESRQRVHGLDDTLRALLHRVRQAAADLGADWPAPDTPTGLPDQRAATEAEPDASLADTVLERAALARVEARERLAVRTAAVHHAQRRRTRALAHWEEQRDLHQRQTRHARAGERLAALLADQERQLRLRARWERAQAARRLAPALRMGKAAREEHGRAVEAERRARAALSGPDADAPWATLVEREEHARARLTALEAADRAERQLDQLRAHLDRLDQEDTDDEATRVAAEDWLADWDEHRARLHGRLEEAQWAATEAEQLAARLTQERARHGAALRREELTQEQETGERQLWERRQREADAREHWLELRERRLAGVAASLAESLRPGEPCAVCGSPEHPRPAPTPAHHVDGPAEEEALGVHQRAQAEREATERELHALTEALARAREVAGEEPPEDLEATCRTLERRQSEARERASTVPALRRELEEAEGEHGRRLTLLTQARTRATERASRRQTLLAERDTTRQEVDRLRDGAEDVAKAVAETERQVTALARAVTAAREEEASRGRAQAADAELTDATFQAGFADPGEAREALLDPEAEAELARTVEEWRAHHAAATAELADPTLVEASERPPARVEEAHAETERATEAVREAAVREETARGTLDQLVRLGREVHAAVRELGPLREEYDLVARLAGLTAGTSAQNARRMRLETYVLAARLEQVASVASQRLQHMSGGRYTLVHSDQRSQRGARSGLGLHVIDSWTGQQRDTATLSGGETFFAALALALGLADVVCEEAGGARLETLFIDEGFGSLDEQTLDEVLDVLDALRSQDRSVGIVSHVPDLRQRIPAQLEVTKSRSGSRVRHHDFPTPA
ncbi:SMC family ATPase [Streptomyces sp. NPDC005438]|uniref:SMC family ATPase n=1 Tax=Streptomyces sp. NPDC005438 TaxID=3156880 RepID=UPI0033B708F2